MPSVPSVRSVAIHPHENRCDGRYFSVPYFSVRHFSVSRLAYSF
jgi:hypothetical protein